MRTTRKMRTIVAIAAAGLTLVVTACYPPSQNPTDQPIPPGGKVVATGPILTEMWIEDATDDLSTILYARSDFLLPLDPVPYRFWVWNENTSTTTEVPVGRAEWSGAALSPDGRSVVFTSNDRQIQVGPTSVNCKYGGGPFTPPNPMMCDELYLFDLDTGVRTQLTGLDGSSEVDHLSPSFTDDGQSILFVVVDGNYSWTTHRLDLATGLIEEIPAPQPPSFWDRGTHEVSWDATTGTLTSQDEATGDVTTLWADDAVFGFASATGNGRYIVVSNWVTPQHQVFRLIDTDTGTVRTVKTPWISEDGSRYALVQRNVMPDATDRLVIAPLLP